MASVPNPATVTVSAQSVAAPGANVALPEMKRYHYDSALAGGTVAAGGSHDPPAAGGQPLHRPFNTLSLHEASEVARLAADVAQQSPVRAAGVAVDVALHAQQQPLGARGNLHANFRLGGLQAQR